MELLVLVSSSYLTDSHRELVHNKENYDCVLDREGCLPHLSHGEDEDYLSMPCATPDSPRGETAGWDSSGHLPGNRRGTELDRSN